MKTYDVSISGLKCPATEPEIWNFVKGKLDELLDALKNQDQNEVREISSGIYSLFEQIREVLRVDKEFKIRREVEKRPRDEDEYDTSEVEQSKSYEDAQEIMEGAAVESDVELNEAFSFAEDMLDELERLPVLKTEELIKNVTDLKAKWFEG
jgi:hypothetical protein